MTRARPHSPLYRRLPHGPNGMTRDEVTRNQRTRIFGGMIDYMNMLNARDGGVGGVKLTYEKCETEYNNARGVECYEREKKKGPTGATVIHPLSTGITYSLIEKVAQDKIPMISLGYGRTDASDGRAELIRSQAGESCLSCRF